MNESSAKTAEHLSSSLGPGDRLQAARISIGLSLEDVATKMHLSSAILTSLEDNNFDEITAPIFVKGYLRSYARIVDIDEEEIIQQYGNFTTEEDPPISSTSNAVPEINSDDSYVKWITWLIIIGLIGLLSAWWWTRYQKPAETLSLESGENTELQISSINSGSERSSQPMMQNSEESNTDDSLTEQVQIELATLETKQVDEPVMPAQIESNMDSGQTVEGAIETSVVNEQPTAVENSLQVSAAVDENGLVITVNSDTWADIKDADGNKLVYDLLRSGETISVNGKTPFRAFLGNGYGVSMKYQGEAVDLSSVIRADNTARIRIGQ